MKLMMVLFVGLATEAVAIAQGANGLEGSGGVQGSGGRPPFPSSKPPPVAGVQVNDGKVRTREIESRRRQIAMELDNYARQITQLEKQRRDSIWKWQNGKNASGAPWSTDNKRRQKEIDRLRELITRLNAEYADL